MRKLTLFNKNTKYILSLLCICISSVQAEDSTTLTTSGDDIQASLQHDQFKSDLEEKGDAISPIRTRSLVLTKWQAATVLTIIVVLVAGAYWKLSAKKQIKSQENLEVEEDLETVVVPVPVDPTPPRHQTQPQTMEKAADNEDETFVAAAVIPLLFLYFWCTRNTIKTTKQTKPQVARSKQFYSMGGYSV